MKTLTKSFIALFTVAFAISVTSCLSDNSDDAGNYIQPGTEEYTTYLTMAAGSYTGKMYFYNDTITTTSSNQSKADSIDVAVNVVGVSDSMIYTRIPANYLLKSVTKNDELVKALEDKPIPVSAKFYLSQAINGVLYFGVYPIDATVSANYEGSDHEIRFEFFRPLNYWGAYNKSRMQIQMSLQNIKVDGKNIKQFSQSEMAKEAMYLFDLKKEW